MASVTVSTVGGDPQRVEADTVEDALREVGLPLTSTVLVNKEPADLGTFLGDEDFLSVSTPVKGG
jgi:sulfur carrier protein ThiS